jgi:hypothetical protein
MRVGEHRGRAAFGPMLGPAARAAGAGVGSPFAAGMGRQIGISRDSLITNDLLPNGGVCYLERARHDTASVARRES